MENENKYNDNSVISNNYINNDNLISNNYDNNDHQTDFSKGLSYLTWDGKEMSTMEQVMEYNQLFYDSLMIQKQNNSNENNNMSR